MKPTQPKKRQPCTFGTPDTGTTAPQAEAVAELVSTPTRSQHGKHRARQAGIDGIKAARRILDEI